ncbi:F-box domain-containing protein [Psidium guajava]|nr:F-box domain-containing protein [Psidium guajava]
MDDLISDLPQSILESILTRLPIRDAVKTSILSTKWRYKWTSITELVFDDKCVSSYHNESIIEGSLVKFITRALFLHQGPINKFQVSTCHLKSCPDIDQWILFLSRSSDVRELILKLGEDEWVRVPSCLFSCKKLTRLELSCCELDPPPCFKGFLCLRSLSLHRVLVAADAIENLIWNCPLLENLALSYFDDSLAITIRAPNLKQLYLEGDFTDIFLENTPLLRSLSVVMYMADDMAEQFELGQSSNCNFVKFLSRVPCLVSLTGRAYFAKYLSVGDDPGPLPITFDHLKIIELFEVSFEDMKEVLVLLRMITSSPNLEELCISAGACTSPAEAPDSLDIWERECPADWTFKQLKVVMMTEVDGMPHEMELLKFLLGSSPVLKTMTISPSTYFKRDRMDMLVELLRFRRASSEAEIIFLQE